MTAARELLVRRVAPRAVVARSRLDAPAHAAAGARRRLGRSGRVELFFAFDDPQSAIALLGLAERCDRRAVRLELVPVVRRGIPGDPAVARKREYARVDAARRAPRLIGTALRRGQAPAPDEVAFLAEWVAAGPPGPALERFATAAIWLLWCGSDGPVDRDAYAELWRATVGEPVPAPESGAAVRRAERRMRRRGPYDVPAAWVHGRWFFAHERLDQIAARLDALGWTPA